MASSCKHADIERAIVRLEEEGWRALAAGRGVGFYRDNFGDEGLMVFASGVFDKAQALQALAAVPPGRVCAISEEAALRDTHREHVTCHSSER